MSGLRSYRCYLLDAASHILSAEVVACSDDDAVKLRAREILAKRPDCRGIEVWEYDRRVHIQLNDAAPLSTVTAPLPMVTAP